MRIVEEDDIKYPFSIDSHINDCYDEEFKKIENICKTKRNIYEKTYKGLMEKFEKSKNENKKKCEIRISYKLYILENKNKEEIYLIEKAFLNFECFLKNKNYVYKIKVNYYDRNGMCYDLESNKFCRVDRAILIDLGLDNESLNNISCPECYYETYYYETNYYENIYEKELKYFMDIFEKAKNDNSKVCNIEWIYDSRSRCDNGFWEKKFVERKAFLDFEYFLIENKYSYTIKDFEDDKGDIDYVCHFYKKITIDLK